MYTFTEMCGLVYYTFLLIINFNHIIHPSEILRINIKTFFFINWFIYNNLKCHSLVSFYQIEATGAAATLVTSGEE